MKRAAAYDAAYDDPPRLNTAVLNTEVTSVVADRLKRDGDSNVLKRTT